MKRRNAKVYVVIQYVTDAHSCICSKKDHTICNSCSKSDAREESRIIGVYADRNAAYKKALKICPKFECHAFSILELPIRGVRVSAFGDKNDNTYVELWRPYHDPKTNIL